MQKALFHRFHDSLFHSDHVRGIVGDTLNLEDAYMVGKILGTIALHENIDKAIIGYDGRPSSMVIEKELARGLVTAGIKVMNISIASAAMLWFLDDEMQPGLSIMIGAGAYPTQYNGFRIKLQGKPFHGEMLKRIPKIGLTGNWRTSEGGSYISGHADMAYAKKILANLNDVSSDIKAIWCSSAELADKIWPQFASSLTGSHQKIMPSSDATIDATLKKNVLDENADIGFGIDNQCEWLHMVDDKGRMIDPDRALPIILEYLSYGAIAGKKILLDPMVSRTICDYLKQQNVIIEFYAEGLMQFHGKMLDGDYFMGIHMKGHFFFGTEIYYGIDDVFLMALKMLEISSKFHPISEKIDTMPYSVISPIETITVQQKKPSEYLATLNGLLEAGGDSIETTDKYLFVQKENGWYIIFANQDDGTILIRAEANNHDIFNKIRDEMLALLQKANILEVLPVAEK